MARLLWFFNLLLALLVSALAWALVDSVVGARGASLEPETSAVGGRPGATPESDASPPEIAAQVPPLSDFDVILARDAFKNPFAAAPRPVAPPPPPPPLPPLPTLVGTIFVGEERKAILASNNRAEVYGLGQSVAGGTLVTIEVDRVVIQRASISAEILLKTALQPVFPAASRSQVKPATQTGQAAPQADVPAETRAAEGAPRVVPGYPNMRGAPRTERQQQGIRYQ